MQTSAPCSQYRCLHGDSELSGGRFGIEGIMHIFLIRWAHRYQPQFKNFIMNVERFGSASRFSAVIFRLP
jgi:hypothetical protein